MKKATMKVLSKYSNKYIALTSDHKTVLASGATIKELEKNLEKQKVKDIEITYIPPVDRYIAPVFQY